MHNNYILIGFPKCGNTSINYMFQSLDIKFLQHWNGKGNTGYLPQQQHEQFIELQPNTAISLGTMGHIDYFEEYYNRYPQALFILNYRPIRNYLISLFKWASIDKTWSWPITEEVVNERVRMLENHYSRVDKFFKDKPLLRLNIESPNWTNELTKAVTGQIVDIPNFHMNKHNVSDDLMKMITETVDSALDTGYKYYES